MAAPQEYDLFSLFLGRNTILGKKNEKRKAVIESNTNLRQFGEQFQNEVLESPSYHFNKTISKYCTVITPNTYTAFFPSRTCTFTKTSAHFTIREFETGRKRTSEWLETMPGKNLSSESWSSTVFSKLQCNMSQAWRPGGFDHFAWSNN